MRKIQFRAWDNINKKWITDYKKVLPAHYEGSKFPIEHGGVDHNCVYVPIGGFEDEPSGYVGDCDLLLFTGVKDKNGKEIYEGDFLKREGDNNLYLIKWSKLQAGFMIDRKGWISDQFITEMRGLKNMVIIGNIYENPEYVKEEARA